GNLQETDCILPGFLQILIAEIAVRSSAHAGFAGISGSTGYTNGASILRHQNQETRPYLD
ncbi:MAG: hypothetical protein LW629_09640, partial [Burkholderiales bacterium]|nr:hypothetical protein [Burkholderiales bacterium]